MLGVWAQWFAASHDSDFLTTSEVAASMASWVSDCANDIEIDFSFTRASVKEALERLHREQSTLGAPCLPLRMHSLQACIP